jgi:hypothetical protein
MLSPHSIERLTSFRESESANHKSCFPFAAIEHDERVAVFYPNDAAPSWFRSAAAKDDATIAAATSEGHNAGGNCCARIAGYLANSALSRARDIP